MKKSAWLAMSIAFLSCLGAWADSTVEVEITGETAVALYQHLDVQPVISENEWFHEISTKVGKNVICVLDLVQEGIVVRQVHRCTMRVSKSGAVTH